MKDFGKLSQFQIFKDVIQVPKENMTLLGAPILQGQTLDKAPLETKVDELEKAIDRFSLLQSHDALVLLKNSISIQKLLYVLRTSNCYNHPLLIKFNNSLKLGLSTILNVDFDEAQWIQATLPVKHQGLRVRCPNTLATTAFWHLLLLQQSIILTSHNLLPYTYKLKVKLS